MRSLLLLVGALFALGIAPAMAADDREVKVFIEAWRDAQNHGDFAAYERLYGQRFTGVRRSGPRERRFDRAGWMKDREHMFGRPMAVVVDDLQIVSAGTEADVRFTQRFSQGSYHDSGSKHVVVVREGGALKIVMEELLASKLDGGAKAKRGDLIGLVTDDTLLFEDHPDSAWGTGPAKLVRPASSELYVARTAVQAGKSPRASMVGQDVDLIEEEGDTCDGQVSALALWTGLVPHFGTVQAWEEAHTKPAEIAKQIVADASAETQLVGLLKSKCTGVLAARREGATAPVTTARDLPPGALWTLALRATKKLRAYAALSADLKKEAPQLFEQLGRQWHEDAAVHMAALDVKIAGTTERWISVSITRFESCGEWSGELWALYRVGGTDEAPTLTRIAAPGPLIYPLVAVDLDGDGWPELLYKNGGLNAFGLLRGVLWSNGGRYDRRQEVTVPYHDCPC